MKYFVFCPSRLVTGGPDALHQLVYYMRLNKIDATIAYICGKNENLAVPENYKYYFEDFTKYDDIVDEDNIGIICPETHLYYVKKFKNAKIYVRWLSVDFNYFHRDLFHKFIFLLKYPIKYILKHNTEVNNVKKSVIYNLLSSKYKFKNEKENIIHLCASYYAYDYVTKRTSRPTLLLVEPISAIFLNKYKSIDVSNNLRKNIILYNPKKNGVFLKKIIDRAGDLKFVPIVGYSQDELIDLYLHSKIYVDFGYFPGAERMPKEAVLFGCLIITGKKGASKYYEDVMIDDDYKFIEDEGNIDKIITLIKNMLTNYEEYIHSFEKYKKHVLLLEENFIKKINEEFK